ncbi:hypothetical protein SS1G_05489 [Sclerotinia sclerotiorum 1980 UF-70]|uniref:Chitin synthesis regulation, Congo red resistance, RCR protein n=2 Tax=Sclerotinia sclerotiorum (strain ATCC 18683 / 1980 / Ss-1) TaxID=665079 RepID=A0A1D9QAJ6_SCLS1|nr:hypothetical protein SS1G_05489 [Sclerotinia sclerotiorum 1980 UF-70]APA11941.1 hypothetical protein sscle_08g067110 [Sclerotinia sclerotiorum 1980 UF-70]EDO03012.1 hypothetical protein SS1G_05489 [Sclerotinia sclerotiorum 1980 UF-70]
MGVLPIDTREALHLNELHSRATCYRRGYGYYRCNSAWYRFGRWILAGILIFVGLILLFAIMCITRRRRRRNQIRSGNTPMTYNQSNTYGPSAPNNYNSQSQQQYAPPAGAPPNYGGGNQDYYGASGVTQPQNTYAK